MTLPPRARKLVLTAHVTSSLGWLGALVVFLVLAIRDGVTFHDGRPCTADDVRYSLIALAVSTSGSAAFGTRK